MFLSLFVTSALALPNYPGELANDLSMPCTPTCTVCHATNAGGSGTVTAAFGVAMMARGMTTDTTTIQPALDAMGTDMVDSDGDGVIDIDELAAGTDPNNTGVDLCGSGTPTIVPQYGCVNTVPGAAPTLAGVFGALLATVTLRRKRA